MYYNLRHNMPLQTSAFSTAALKFTYNVLLCITTILGVIAHYDSRESYKYSGFNKFGFGFHDMKECDDDQDCPRRVYIWEMIFVYFMIFSLILSIITFLLVSSTATMITISGGDVSNAQIFDIVYHGLATVLIFVSGCLIMASPISIQLYQKKQADKMNLTITQEIIDTMQRQVRHQEKIAAGFLCFGTVLVCIALTFFLMKQKLNSSTRPPSKNVELAAQDLNAMFLPYQYQDEGNEYDESIGQNGDYWTQGQRGQQQQQQQQDYGQGSRYSVYQDDADVYENQRGGSGRVLNSASGRRRTGSQQQDQQLSAGSKQDVFAIGSQKGQGSFTAAMMSASQDPRVGRGSSAQDSFKAGPQIPFQSASPTGAGVGVVRDRDARGMSFNQQINGIGMGASSDVNRMRSVSSPDDYSSRPMNRRQSQIGILQPQSTRDIGSNQRGLSSIMADDYSLPPIPIIRSGSQQGATFLSRSSGTQRTDDYTQIQPRGSASGGNQYNGGLPWPKPALNPKRSYYDDDDD